MRVAALGLAVVVISCFSAQAEAEGFAVFNQSSFARAAALPALGQGTVLAVGESQTLATLDWANEYVSQSNSRESLTVDAETQRYALRYRRGFGGSVVSVSGWEWGVEVPVVASNGGLLDSAIENWHSAFSLPNGGREQAPRNRYRIDYKRDGVQRLLLTKGDTTLGDVRLSLGAALGEQLAVHAMVQLPTGDQASLTGGHVGGALWGDWTLPLGSTERTKLTLSAGGSSSASGGPLGDQQKSFVGLGGVALSGPLLWRVDGVAQLNAHTALYGGSSLDPLHGASAQLAFGLRYPWAGGSFALGVQEDLVVNTSPDFSLHFALALGRVAGDPKP